MTAYVYVCPKCGRPNSWEEFRENRFCRRCGKFLTENDWRVVEEGKIKKKREKTFMLEREVEDSLEITYELIQRNTPYKTQIDSLEVIKQVEEYRQFWKPKRTNVVLLAESHVYTDEQDYKIECKSSILYRIIPNYPVNFVKFVYCLGYGENELLNRRPKSNPGTWQFWKMFSYCVGEDETKVLKMRTGENLEKRLKNKVNVLRRMKQRGIWLLDASIIGLYRSGIKEYPDECKRIIRVSWRNYIGDMIEEAQPKHIIVIGKSVEKILHFELQKLKVPHTAIDAPQAHLESQKQRENYEKYQTICTTYT